MKHRVFAAAVLGAAAWLASMPVSSQAFGGKLFKKDAGGDCGTCAAPAPAACAPACGVAYAAPACATAPVTYVEQEVEVLVATEVKTPTKVKVLKMVEVQKEVTYKVAQMKIVKQEVASYQWVQVKKPYEYYVNKLVNTVEKRDVMECVRTPKETMVDVVTYQCVPKMVVENVAVCKRVPVAPACGMTAGCGSPCADACAPVCAAPAPACAAEEAKTGPVRGLLRRLCGKTTGGTTAASCAPACAPAAPACGPMYTTVVEMVPVQKCVYENVAVKSQVKQVTYTEAWVKKTIDVNVTKCITELVKSERLVSECQLVKTMADVQVCEWVDKKEMAKVWECKEVEETIDVITCKMVPTKQKVKVAVAAPVVAAGCGSPCGVAPTCGAVASCAPACAPAACTPACEEEKEGLIKRLLPPYGIIFGRK